MTWTTPADLKAQVQRLWDRGLLLSSLAGGEAAFPRRLALKVPGSREIRDCFTEVQGWISGLTTAAGLYRIKWRKIRHRTLGTNEIPSEIWIDSMEDALGLINKRRSAEQFAALVELTGKTHPELVPWLAKKPLRALEMGKDWSRLLSVVTWMRGHSRPAIYLRQMDLPGVHTKLIEQYRGVLAEWFDMVLPPEAVDTAYTGVGGFCRRYGFLDKPLRIRFRILDPKIRLLSGASDQDVMLTQTAFANLDLPISIVFITENEINFLSFPEVSGAMVIFGAGYGFENLAAASWLRQKKILYWGDIDTHGFAILNQLRKTFPNAASFLMDRKTFLAHRTLWGTEPHPKTGNLERLNAEESAFFDELRCNRWGDRLRLEQERIGFDMLEKKLSMQE